MFVTSAQLSCQVLCGIWLIPEEMEEKCSAVRRFGGSAVLLLMASPAAAELSFEDIVGNLTGRATRVQRDAFWEQNEGQQATITGRVTDVRPEGWVLPMTVEMSTPRSDVTVSCMILKSSESRAAELGIGDEVTCRGSFFNYMLLFDTLSISLDNATLD